MCGYKLKQCARSQTRQRKIFSVVRMTERNVGSYDTQKLYAFVGSLITRVRNRSDEMKTSFLQLLCQRTCTNDSSFFQFIIIYDTETRQNIINTTDSYESIRFMSDYSSQVCTIKYSLVKNLTLGESLDTYRGKAQFLCT